MLDVRLAGHNIDADVLKKLKESGWDGKNNLTPETISAAYARISRDPRPVYELREDAREEVDKARKSNEAIVFKMGHHSVAEHAYMNFDILGLSRLAVESLEEARLCAYTEKSQRYITLSGDYVRPAEFDAAEIKIFEDAIKAQVEAYNRAFPILHEYQKSIHADRLATKSGQNMVEGWAKEDARYMVALATECQLGFSCNSRNLEYIIRKLKYSRLAEVRQLSKELYDKAVAVVPSLIILSDPEAFKKQFGWEVSDGFLKTRGEKMERMAKNVKRVPLNVERKQGKLISLVNSTKDADTAVVAALLCSASEKPYDACLKAAKKLGKTGQAKLVKELFKGFTEFDSMPREFEAAQFTFEIIISAGAFGQLKRHRMMSIFKQPYDISLGVTVPPAIAATKQEKIFSAVMKQSEAAYKKLAKKNKSAAEYALTNAHRRRVIASCDLRELYHVARLRMDSHAQWDIQDVSRGMVETAKKAAPITAALACGKDAYKEVYNKFINNRE